MRRILFILLTMLLASAFAQAVDVQLLLPLGRTAYQTNEQIDLAVVRAGDAALPADTLTLTLTGKDASVLTFTFPVPAAPEGRATEPLRLNGWLLRPGTYTVTARVNGAEASTEIGIYSHLRKSTFTLLDWGSRAQGGDIDGMGADGMGFNVLYSTALGDNAVRGGLDFTGCCVMGGGHQMDLRMDLDWSDPRVMWAVESRAAHFAMRFRTSPNAIGIHFYDEPGLTWAKHPDTGETVPHNVPTQDASYKAAFGEAPLQYNKVTPDDPATVAKWEQYGRWKLSLMDAAWRRARYGVEQVNPDYLSLTQSMYGYNAYADGYYFNVARSLPVLSGHGGYDDLSWGYWQPEVTFAFGRARQLDKPSWYLPAWYNSTRPDAFRMEQYLSFMTGLQGMGKPPDMGVHQPWTNITAPGIVESNKTMARLGTIFTTMPVTRPSLAVLYSLSQCLYAQEQSGMKDNYTAGGHTARANMAFMAAKLLQVDAQPVVEEDILDGTLAQYHKAVLLAGVDSLRPEVVTALEGYIAAGGTVLLTDECKVQIGGAQRVGGAADPALFDQEAQLWADKKLDERAKIDNVGNVYRMVEPLEKALAPKLAALKILPVLETDSRQLAASRQAWGDIEYVFAVNATYNDMDGGKNALKPAKVTIGLPDDGRPVYDAMYGGPVAEFAAGLHAAPFTFGAGQMRVFARTARPIGGVQVGTPTVTRELTRGHDPIAVLVRAALVDNQNRVLVGAAPLQVRVIDPLGSVRYDLYRATREGTLELTLPLAANDPAGAWRINVTELLNNTTGSATFTYQPAGQCGAIAGAGQRALIFGDDRARMYRFFRTHSAVSLVVGTTATDREQAERLAANVKPWGITCTLVDAATVNKPRTLTDEEARTWAGMNGSTRKPSDANVVNTGFAIDGPVVLFGNPDDNPLIAFSLQQGMLPYTPKRGDLPGAGRGYLAWQTNAVVYGQDSVSCIAYDAAGMAEATGTLYEVMAGLDPLTPLALPLTATVVPATKADAPPAAKTARLAVLPDGVAALATTPQGVVSLSKAGVLALLGDDGKARWQQSFPAGEFWALTPSADGAHVAVGAGQHVLCVDVADGNMLFDKTLDDTKKPAVLALAFSADGKLAASGRNGQVAVFDLKGKRLWLTGGVTAAQLTQYDDAVKARDVIVKSSDEAARAWDVYTAGMDKTAMPPKPAAPPLPSRPQPDPFYALAFGAGGLYAATATEVQTLAATDGALTGKLAGVDGSQAALQTGGTWLLSDGAAKLRSFALGEGKFAGQGFLVPLPAKGRVLAVGGTAAQPLVASTDHTVRRLGAWEFTCPNRVPKLLADGDTTAVAYWGGQVDLLDKDGKLIARAQLPQDPTALTWTGKTLLVGLADGQLYTVQAP